MEERHRRCRKKIPEREGSVFVVLILGRAGKEKRLGRDTGENYRQDEKKDDNCLS